MQKLLQINVTANWGSTGKIAEQIGVAVMKAGWESYIAYGRWANPSQSHLIKIGGHWNKYLHYLEQFFFDNEGLCSRRATRQLIKRIKELKPDIVQLHNIHDHYLNYRLLFEYLNRSDIKVVWSFHDCWAFTGHCFHFVTAGCEKWKTNCCSCPQKNGYPKTMVDRSKKNYELKRSLFGSCKDLTIVACSDWMSGLVKHSFLKDKNITVIHNGVDLRVFKQKTTEIEYAGTYMVLCVSSVWNKAKGLLDIYKLRELLPSKYRIIIVGLTEKQIRVLPAGIEGAKRTHNVRELVQFYSSANVLINPTYADTFPTVNLEALACGTPVVTYRTGGCPETVDEKTGVIVEQGDVAAMAEAVRVICGRNRMQYATDCRNRSEAQFDEEMCFEKYLTLYESLLR